jgi:hypothetical protein
VWNRSEKLTEFEVKPLRRRKAATPKAKAAEATPKLEGEKTTPPAATTTEKP